MKVKIKAPAKINLTLEILNKRNDGYHVIKSLMQTISLYDEIVVERDDSNSINITCDNPNVPLNQDNLVYKAVIEFCKFTNIANTGISIDIEKNIPLEAGLAGGSTDAAATIVAMNRLFNTNLDIDDLCDIGEEVGADVPFCIVGGTIIAEGIGNILTPVPNMPETFIVLAKPHQSVSTKCAYDLVDTCKPSWRNNYTDEAAEAICDSDISALAAQLYNRFEDVTDIDEINTIKSIMKKYNVEGTLMTGSGSTVFGLFKNKNDADDAIDELEEQVENIYLCKPVNHGCFIDD